MLENAMKCNHFDISIKLQSETSFDFDALVPDVDQLTSEEELAIAEAEAKLK